MLYNTNTITLVLLSVTTMLVEGNINPNHVSQAPGDIEYPDFRFKSWEFLTHDQKAFAETLGYVEGTWDQPGSADVERKSFDELSHDELAAAEALGFDEDQWDCYVNHYGSYNWQELQDDDVQEYFNVLGWTYKNWRGLSHIRSSKPNSELEDWADLTPEERQAAKSICYFRETWDEINFKLWDCATDHYNDYNWNELEEEGVAQYFAILGWTPARWNGSTKEPPESENKNWDELTEEEHVAARKLCYYKKEWDGPAFPTFRFRSWEYLTSNQKVNAKNLKYTEDLWNRIASNYIEELAFDGLESREQDSVKAIGFEEEVWDCYINHYEGYDWDELYEENVQSFFIVLGWSSANWNDGQVASVEAFNWDDLNPAQQTAAKELCYIKESWDEIPLDEWDCSKDHFSEKTWADLEDMGVQQYFITLGWDYSAWSSNEAPASESMEWNELSKEEETAARNLCYLKEEWNGPTDFYPIFRYHLWDLLDTNIKAAAFELDYNSEFWNQVGSADVESHSYETLSNQKKKAADTMGFTEDTWDCWQNHYEDYYWSELEEFDILDDVKVFGWTEDTWNDQHDGDVTDLPKHWNTDWKNLSRDLQGAAENLCYFEEIWDGVPLDKWDCSSSHYLDYDWDELKDEGVQGYFAALGWNESSWEGDSEPPLSENREWTELSQEQRIAARQICYTKNVWDDEGQGGRKSGTITGVAIGVVFVVVLAAAFFLRRKMLKDPGIITTTVPNFNAFHV